MGAGLRRATAAAKRTRYPGTPKPAVGQRWQDCDKRGANLREVVILKIEEDIVQRGRTIDAALCDVYIDGARTGRKVTIDVARLLPTSTGYRYVGDGPPGAAVAT